MSTPSLIQRGLNALFNFSKPHRRSELNKCLVYPSEEQRALDKDRALSHFWTGLQVHGRVSVVL